MKISEIASILNGTILCCEENSEEEVFSACGSDMMSDVLAYVKNQAVLLTGLVNPQVIRTADMMDMKCVVFVRNKIPSKDILEIAKENGIVVMKTERRMYEACGLLYTSGLNSKNGE
jgi:hypothetical protein